MTVMGTAAPEGVRDLCPYQGIGLVDADQLRGICPD
jgi:hypothetical protein